MPEKSLAFVVLAFGCALLAQSASAKPVSRNALDRCALRGGTIEPFGSGSPVAIQTTPATAFASRAQQRVSPASNTGHPPPAEPRDKSATAWLWAKL
jgi:hypothetical protein